MDYCTAEDPRCISLVVLGGAIAYTHTVPWLLELL